MIVIINIAILMGIAWCISSCEENACDLLIIVPSFNFNGVF